MRTLIHAGALSVFLLLFASASILLQAQESSAPRGAPPTAPSLSLPPSFMESMREQLNPFQPQKLQRLLMNPDVQGELEIDRSTYSLIAMALIDVTKKSAEIFKGIEATDSSDPEAVRARLEKYKQLQVERAQVTEEALFEIFPPKKYERLKQIALQIQIQEAGLSNVLLYGVLAEEMHFSDAQLETISSKAAQYEQEKQAKIRKLNEEYDAKLLGNLTSKQRKQFEQQVGEAFEYVPVSTEAKAFDRLRGYGQRLVPGSPSP